MFLRFPQIVGTPSHRGCNGSLPSGRSTGQTGLHISVISAVPASILQPGQGLEVPMPSQSGTGMHRHHPAQSLHPGRRVTQRLHPVQRPNPGVPVLTGISLPGSSSETGRFVTTPSNNNRGPYRGERSMELFPIDPSPPASATFFNRDDPMHPPILDPDRQVERNGQGRYSIHIQ